MNSDIATGLYHSYRYPEMLAEAAARRQAKAAIEGPPSVGRRMGKERLETCQKLRALLQELDGALRQLSEEPEGVRAAMQKNSSGLSDWRADRQL